MMLQAVAFDLDGVLIDSERVWNAVREQVVRGRGGSWRADATAAMMGMSSPEWSRYMHERLGVQMSATAIAAEVLARMEDRYRAGPPLIDGAREAVLALAPRWPLAVASSANASLIELVLEQAGLRASFAAVVSAEEVPKGKPAPDVYLEAARRLGVEPSRCAAVEDSSNGLRAAAAANTLVVAVPNRDYPPEPGALRLADVVIASLSELHPQLLEDAARRRG
ncbi:MAG TPA: HAD family phosphatase [Solirubrobacteraceae bacterium]|jgi:HAD superfamily hydrolase (TIGR01509 family)|nr:HAD family phosphatase [Solirubrobacteraceae bacterium]